MKLTPIKANMTEVQIGDKRVLFSYKTPVAYYQDGKAYQTNKKWSQTTTRHINQWFGSMIPNPKDILMGFKVDQDVLDNLIK